ncbi:protein kinase domain-containing protein (plasmid) [Tundrisphaera lichenicola]|uniref:serine/threonine-protein kinase n=1 Tax=Tundrisphaera lichenicola TaxID=2029860 RepID=UPI003EB9DE17
MPLDQKHVHAVFLSAVDHDDPAARALFLDHECSTDEELRRRVEVLLSAHDQSNGLPDRPIDGVDIDEIVSIAEREGERPGIGGPASSNAACDGSAPTVGLEPNADLTAASGASSGSGNAFVPSIEGYEILEELGRGGMGVVYKARQVLLNRPCALKMILGGVLASPSAFARFLAEAQAIARLHHPHIVQIHHIGESEGLPFFELEYVEGGGLDRTLDGTPWNARRAAGFVEVLAGAVAEAHRMGIVHRDLKPGNILLKGDGTPMITDFGLAKSLDSDSGLTATDSIMGSPSYMSPEQATGLTGEIGASADIYALGATLYELVTGRPPFRGTSILETLDQVKTVEPVPPSRLVPGLPRDVETIALKCLQKEPVKRYESATAMAADLRRFLGGESILARPVGPIERGWRWGRRNPVVAGLAAALASILVLATAGSLAAYWRMSTLAHTEHEARLTAVKEMQAAQEAREREAAQRSRAEANFHRARAAVDGYLTTVSESQLLKVPGLQPLRGELLESALRFYREFLKERGDDPMLRAELAATQLRIGQIQTELGASDEARRTVKSAIAAYQAEVARNPRDVALRAALADAWLALSHLAYNFGGQDSRQEWLEAFAKNSELREGLARDRPDDPHRQEDFAAALNYLGFAQDEAGRDGMLARLRGAEIRLALILKSPDDPKISFGLGESLGYIAVTLSNSGRHEDALAMYLRGREYQRFAYDKLPHMIEYGCDLGTSSMNAVRAYRSLGRSDEAVAEAQQAVDHCRRMVRDHPALTIVRRQFVWALEALVESQRDAGRAAEAARTGRELGHWLDIVVDTPQLIYDGASWHARLSLWADERKGSLANQDQDEAHREADRAVEQLQQAVESGFADLEAVRKNNALDPLRDRADFQKLVANLEERLRPRPQAAPAMVAVPESGPASSPVSGAERVFRARADRAAVLHAVGVVQRLHKRHDEARDWLEKARLLCEQLLRERPSDTSLQATLADTHRTLGSMDY